MAIKFRNRYLLLVDGFLLFASALVAYSLRFDGFSWPPEQSQTALIFAVTATPLCIIIFLAFGLYRRLWRKASVFELERILFGAGVGALASIALGALVLPA